jgi:Kef-type K+ transport system membrane component KefB
VARGLRQPLILAYVATGVLIGPVGLGLITDMENISLLGELGVAFLLFVAGLELDFGRIRSVGLSSLVGGAAQIFACFCLGLLIVALLGMPAIMGIYVGLLFAFSSTMIVAKFLVDKNEVDTLHGRTMLSVLLLQDVVAVLALTFLTKLDATAWNAIAWTVGGVVGLFVGAYLLNRFVFNRLMEYAAESKEMLFFTSIAVCFLFMGFAYGMGLSVAIGAFIAGISLAGLPYNIEISSELSFVRDFFAVLFFATLGMQLNLFVISEMFSVFLLFLFVIMFVKPLILTLIYLAMGYGTRASVDTGVGMGQASEFSFIMAAVGLSAAHLGRDIYSLMLSLVVVSMVLTPYMMRYRRRIHRAVCRRGVEKRFKARLLQRMERIPKGLKNHVVVIGGGVTGREIVDYLRSKRKEFVVVERNPDVARTLRRQEFYTVFGEACHEDVLVKAGINTAKLVVITIPDFEPALFAVREVKRTNRKAKVVVRAHTASDARELREAGADFIIVPELISGEKMIKTMARYL